MLKLSFNDGSRPAIRLSGERVTIGADRSNQIWLQQSLIAPFHAEIRFRNGEAHLLNLEPEHRTGVNGIKVVKAVQLVAGDEITIGRIEMTVLDPPSPASRHSQSVDFEPAHHDGSSPDRSPGSSPEGMYDRIEDNFDQPSHALSGEVDASASAGQPSAQRPEQISFDAVLAELSEEQTTEIPSPKSSYAAIVTLVMVTLAVISTVLVLTDALN